MNPLLRRARVGFAIGLAGATVCSAWVVGAALLMRASAHSADLWRIVAAYYVAGAAAGTVSGALLSLLPLGRGRVGAAACGVLGAAAVYGAIEAVKHRGRPWTAEDSAVLAFVAVAVGAPVGLAYRDMFVGRGGGLPRARDRGTEIDPHAA